MNLEDIRTIAEIVGLGLPLLVRVFRQHDKPWAQRVLTALPDVIGAFKRGGRS